MFRYIDLYKDFVLQYFKILMQSKLNFIIGFLGFFIIQMSGIIFLELIFNHIPDLNGWSFEQLLFIYGFAQLPRGVDHLFTDYLWIFSSRVIVKGEFDRYLVRPINPLFHILSERLQLDALGEIVVGVLIIIFASNKLGIVYTPITILMFIITVFAGTVIYISIKLFFASFAFWIKNSMSLLQMAYMFSDFAKYPNEIYGGPIKVLISFVLPFSFTAFIPASYFMNISSVRVSVGLCCLIAIISFIIAYSTWQRGIKVYESVGN